MKIYTEKTKEVPMPDDYYDKLYLIHHMHHFASGKTVLHELHHCSLYSQKLMKGKQFKITHKKTKDQVEHYVNTDFNGVLYDHAGNSFKINSGRIII